MSDDGELLWLDPTDLWSQLCHTLESLPRTAYLRCLAAFLHDYRRLYDAHLLPQVDRSLIGAVIDMVEWAAAGLPVQAGTIEASWFAHTCPAMLGDEDDPQPYDGPMHMELFKACSTAIQAVKDEENLSGIADGAVNYTVDDDPLAGVRQQLVRCLAKTDEGRPQGGAVLPVEAVRQAVPDDVPAVLALLDDTAAWLRRSNIRQWMTWPAERETVAGSVACGQTWMLETERGAPAAILTLQGTPADARLWDGGTASATYLSWLAVRREFAGQGIGGRLIGWARGHAHRSGTAMLRTAAWPGNPKLHRYLRHHGFRELWTVDGPLATSRTLFVQRAAP